GRAVVDDDHLVRLVASLEVGDDLFQEGREALGLIERGDDDRPAGCHRILDGSGRRRRRAVAVSCAARATPSATAGAPPLFATVGVVYSSGSSLWLTHAARGSAASGFISSV